MLPIIPQNDLIDDVHLQKYKSVMKMQKVMSLVQENDTQKMTKTASSGVDNKTLINLFAKMLETLNMEATDNISEFISSVNKKSDNIDKYAALDKQGKERSDSIKIVSKTVKDSHYQIDVSQDIIKQNGQEVLMVSCYARDAYLGRYMIKRNFFYAPDRSKVASRAYDEILAKVNETKDRYYNEIIDVPSIFNQIKQTLDGVISEIEIKEDSLGTTIHR